MDGTNGPKETTLSVNVFTAPGKAMVGERPRPFGEAFGFDPITSTLILGEHDAVLVDAMTTAAEAEALADWVALHNRNLETGSRVWSAARGHLRLCLAVTTSTLISPNGMAG
jgi:hypothetical protein